MTNSTRYADAPTSIAHVIDHIRGNTSKAAFQDAGAPSTSLQVEIELGRTPVTETSLRKYCTAITTIDPTPEGARTAEALRAIYQLLNQPLTDHQPIELGRCIRFNDVADEHGPIDSIHVNSLQPTHWPTDGHRNRWLRTVAALADNAEVTFVERTATTEWDYVLGSPKTQLVANDTYPPTIIAIDPLAPLQGMPTSIARRVITTLAGGRPNSPWTPLVLTALLAERAPSLATLYSPAAHEITVTGQGLRPDKDEHRQAIDELRHLFAPFRTSIIDALEGDSDNLRLLPQRTVTNIAELRTKHPIMFTTTDRAAINLLGILLILNATNSTPEAAPQEMLVFGRNGHITVGQALHDDPPRHGELRAVDGLDAVAILTIDHQPDRLCAVRIA